MVRLGSQLHGFQCDTFLESVCISINPEAIIMMKRIVKKQNLKVGDNVNIKEIDQVIDEYWDMLEYLNNK